MSKTNVELIKEIEKHCREAITHRAIEKTAAVGPEQSHNRIRAVYHEQEARSLLLKFIDGLRDFAAEMDGKAEEAAASTKKRILNTLVG